MCLAFMPDTRQDNYDSTGLENPLKKKNRMHGAPGSCPEWIVRLPDFGERHLGVEIFKTGFVSLLHGGELGKEQLLLGVSREFRKLRVHLHRLKFFLDCDDKAFDRF